MREISISDFKTKCHSLIREVNDSKQTLCITRVGKPVAEIVPPSPVVKSRALLGSGADTFDILDNNIVGPIIDFK